MRATANKYTHSNVTVVFELKVLASTPLWGITQHAALRLLCSMEY
jgi:hypothetical protein